MVGDMAGNVAGNVAREKSALRSALLAARKSMTSTAREAADDRLLTAVTKLLETVRGKSLAGYVPVGSEPGASRSVSQGKFSGGLVDLLGKDALLPALLPNGDLDWSRGELRPASRGLWEPIGPRLGVNVITSVDVIFVPALAVDLSGARLGRGGGSYDRALARVPDGVAIIALVFDDEVLTRIPTDPHDRPVTGVITPSGGFRPLPR